MRGQAQRVGWRIEDREQAHRVHTTMLLRAKETGIQEFKHNSMDKFESSLEDAIYEAAAPKPLVFSLSRAVDQP